MPCVPILKTEALVLRAIEFSETSLVVWLFTRDHGRVHVIAKGARRARSPFEGALEPLVRAEVLFYRKARAEALETAKEVDPIDLHLGLRTALPRMVRGAYLAELLAAFSEPEVPAPETYDAAAAALALLARGPLAGLDLALARCELAVLGGAGLAPVLDRCARCRGPVFGEGVDRAWFSPGAGGALCLAHGDGERGTAAVTRDGLRPLLALALGRDVDLTAAPAFRAVRGLLDAYVAFHLGRPLGLARRLEPVGPPARARGPGPRGAPRQRTKR